MSTSNESEVAREVKREKRPRDPGKWIHRSIEKYRRDEDPLAFRPNAAFFALADPVVQSKRTLLGYDRLYVFWQAIQNLEGVPGAVAEIGTFRGGSAYFIASAFVAVTGAEVPLHVFDTFEGHPQRSISEHDKFHKPGRFGHTSYEKVRDFLSPFAQVQIHRGDVIESLPLVPESPYRLVHLDTDLYQPTRVCLDYFGRLLSPGGVIVIDDFASRKCPGVPKALGEYLRETDGFQVWDLRTEQVVLVKR